jgi:hypothetical protein
VLYLPKKLNVLLLRDQLKLAASIVLAVKLPSMLK